MKSEFSECMTITAGGSGHERDKAGHGPVVPARGTGTDRDIPFRGMSRLSRPGSHSRLPAPSPATERPVTTAIVVAATVVAVVRVASCRLAERAEQVEAELHARRQRAPVIDRGKTYP